MASAATLAPSPPRLVSLDRFRGVAILAMIVDHVCLVAGGPVSVRLTLGRLALPMFFLLAGHLAGRPRWRHAYIGAGGVLLGVAVPWIDGHPNVLTTWAVGVGVLWLLRRYGVPVWVLPFVALTLSANGWGLRGPGSYDVLALWSLMSLGLMVPRGAFAWAAALPGWVGSLGRHPIRWYVGHILVLDFVVLSVEQGWPWLG